MCANCVPPELTTAAFTIGMALYFPVVKLYRRICDRITDWSYTPTRVEPREVTAVVVGRRG